MLQTCAFLYTGGAKHLPQSQNGLGEWTEWPRLKTSYIKHLTHHLNLEKPGLVGSILKIHTWHKHRTFLLSWILNATETRSWMIIELFEYMPQPKPPSFPHPSLSHSLLPVNVYTLNMSIHYQFRPREVFPHTLDLDPTCPKTTLMVTPSLGTDSSHLGCPGERVDWL